MNTNRQTAVIKGRQQGEQNEDNSLESHPLGRFISDGGRDHFTWSFSCSIHLTFFRQSPPPNGQSSTSLTTAMCFFGLLGITGLYARQVEEAGWLGLAGYLLFSLCLRAHSGLYLRRSLYLAAVGDRGADVCGGLPGDLQRAPPAR